LSRRSTSRGESVLLELNKFLLAASVAMV
jgi:hypothetical protein